MAAYTAFVKIIIHYTPGNTPAVQVVTKQYNTPDEFVSDTEDLTQALNDRLSLDVDSYTIIQKVNGHILDVENVSFDSRYNFQIRKTPN